MLTLFWSPTYNVQLTSFKWANIQDISGLYFMPLSNVHPVLELSCPWHAFHALNIKTLAAILYIISC
jgi:hypothetical protein